MTTGKARITHRAIPTLLAALIVFGCAPSPPPADPVVRVCDGSGCRDQVRGAGAMSEDTRREPEAVSDRVRALRERAQGDPSAAYDLALRAMRGDGVAQSPYRAQRWMRRAASGGHREAQLALGRLYLGGMAEMGPDPAEAQRWLAAAAAQGDDRAAELLELAEAASAAEKAEYEARQDAWRRAARDYWYREASYEWEYHGGDWRHR